MSERATSTKAQAIPLDKVRDSAPQAGFDPAGFDDALFAGDAEAAVHGAAAPTSDAVAGEGASSDLKPSLKQELKRGLGWGAILISSLLGLVAMAASVWVYDLALNLAARQDWIGWLAMGLVGLSAMALLIILLREIIGLIRLRRLGSLRRDAETALERNTLTLARKVAARIDQIMHERKDLRWGRAHFHDDARNVSDARQLLGLADRWMLAPLDQDARAIVTRTARRLAVLTAISPSALIDMAFVLALNFAMLRQVATLYGGRPGFFGVLRLGRMVIGHIVVSGGLALTGDLLHDVVGAKLIGRLSGKLGEGAVNGALTARIGVAAIAVCRPLPHIESQAPKLRAIVYEVVRGTPAPNPPRGHRQSGEDATNNGDTA